MESWTGTLASSSVHAFFGNPIKSVLMPFSYYSCIPFPILVIFKLA